MDEERETGWLQRAWAVVQGDKTREAGGILAMALAVLLGVALATFDPRDPSFFTSPGPHATIRNAAGQAGAELAGDLLGILGIAALLAPPALFAAGWRGVAGRRSGRRLARGAAGALVTASLCLVAALLTEAGILAGGRVERPGGFVGDELYRILLPLLGRFGLVLAAVTWGLLAAVLVSRRPLLQGPVEAAGFIGRLRERWRARRAAGRERRHQPRVVRPSPAAEPTPETGPPGAAAPSPPSTRTPAKAEDRGQRAFPFLGFRGAAFPPPLSLLDLPEGPPAQADREEQEANAQVLERKLLDFGVEGRVTEIHPGPVITRYEIEPAPGIKINRIVALADDLALALKALSVRVVAPIPGKAVVGVEIPNRARAVVHLREILDSREFKGEGLVLPLAVGKDTSGNPFVTDLAQMPHLLIAGATGSGKSVCINALLLSLLYRLRPRELRLLLIDPKRVELSVYNGLPHLAERVVVDARDAARKLQRVVQHMEERYRLFAQVGARNLMAFNRMLELQGEGEAGGRPGPLPLLVVVIDELADLILMAAADVENAVARLAQMARAVGIHLVVATQRPSVDVITGVIKANFPARISFQVSSKVDSRTILDLNGAEQLLGSGDMLFIPPGSSKPIRIHGAFVSDVEVRRLVEFLGAQGKAEDFPWGLLPPEEKEAGLAEEETDELYRQAVDIVVQTRQASISLLQRRLRVGFNRAARLIERMEQDGIVSPMDGTRPREVLVEPPES